MCIRDRRNPNLDLKRKLGLLWRPELVHIQELNKLPGYKEKSKKFVVEKILEKVPADLLAVQISEGLFERDYTAIEETIRAYREGKGKKVRKKRVKT